MTGWGVVKDHLLGYLPTLTGLTDVDAVSDGVSLAETDLTSYAVVGWDGDISRGWYEQDYDTGPMVSETGVVEVRLIARSGDTDLNALQDTVDGWLAALRTHLAADKTLGGLLTQGSTISVGRVDLQAMQEPNGAIVANQVSVNYFTRI